MIHTNRMFKIIIVMVALVQLIGCGRSIEENVNQPETTAEYRLSHGITSLDILTEHINYCGVPIEIEYEFENGNVDANMGLLLFLDGDLQPFAIDSGECQIMNIVDLPADQTKTVTIAFTPVKGHVGQALPLHIVALFDARNKIDSPSIAVPFFQAISQAFPATIMFENDFPVTTFQDYYISNISAVSLESTVMELNAPLETAESKLILPEFSSANDVINKQACFNSPITLQLSNTYEKDTEYHIFAFINNSPVFWGEKSFLSVLVPAQKMYSMSVEINIDDSISEKQIDKNQMFFIAVPIHDANQQKGTMVLKTKTTSIIMK